MSDRNLTLRLRTMEARLNIVNERLRNKDEQLNNNKNLLAIKDAQIENLNNSVKNLEKNYILTRDRANIQRDFMKHSENIIDELTNEVNHFTLVKNEHLTTGLSN